MVVALLKDKVEKQTMKDGHDRDEMVLDYGGEDADNDDDDDDDDDDADADNQGVIIAVMSRMIVLLLLFLLLLLLLLLSSPTSCFSSRHDHLRGRASAWFSLPLPGFSSGPPMRHHAA